MTKAKISVAKISVVIPCKNEEKLIPKLLDCLKNQTFIPEQIIVADKSTDGTRKILEKYNVMVVDGDEDGFIGRARNNGAAVATQPIIVFLDSDVEFDSNFLEKLINEFNRMNLDVATSFQTLDSKSRIVKASSKLYNQLKLLQAKTKKIFSEAGVCVIVKKDMFTKLGGFNEELKNAEDIEFLRRAIKNKYKFGVISISIQASARRLQKGGLTSFVLLVIGAIGLTSLVVFNRPSRGKVYDKFLKWYGKTGG